MTPEEAQIIRSVFDRLKATGANAPRDAEAEALVEALMKADPKAGVGLVQALVVTERARQAAAGQAAALQQEIDTLRSQGAPAAAPQSGGLFGGPWGAAPQPQAPVPQAGPWGGRPQQPGPWDAGQQPQAQQGGGFWSSALRTGAGVAGGLFAFEAVKGLFGGSGAHAATGAGFFDQPTTVINETVNVFQGDGRNQPFDQGYDPASSGGGLFDGDGGFDAGNDDEGWF